MKKSIYILGVIVVVIILVVIFSSDSTEVQESNIKLPETFQTSSHTGYSIKETLKKVTLLVDLGEVGRDSLLETT